VPLFSKSAVTLATLVGGPSEALRVEQAMFACISTSAGGACVVEGPSGRRLVLMEERVAEPLVMAAARLHDGAARLEPLVAALGEFSGGHASEADELEAQAKAELLAVLGSEAHEAKFKAHMAQSLSDRAAGRGMAVPQGTSFEELLGMAAKAVEGMRAGDVGTTPTAQG
jgi:hypothetical protein